MAKIPTQADPNSIRTWQRVPVPGAHCGDGSPYHLLISKGQGQNLTFDFMGGGACWDKESCQGRNPRTITFAVKRPIEKGGLIAKTSKISPVSDDTIVYLPYCTGDVHLADHIANYDGKVIHHKGFRNIELSLATLHNKKLIRFSELKRVVVYGFSAGAIGGLVHLDTVGRYLPATTKRYFLADSPGLHFGDEFWQKFSKELIQDYSYAMGKIGISLTPNDGHIAKSLDLVCRHYRKWKIGILQGSQDIIMSAVFGNISPEDHERLIFSEEGLFEKTRDPRDNCESWIPKTKTHTFLTTTVTSFTDKANSKSAFEFARDLIE